MKTNIRCPDCNVRLWGEQTEAIGNVWPSGSPYQHTWSQCIVRQLVQSQAKVKELEQECYEHYKIATTLQEACDSYYEENRELKAKIKALKEKD